MDKLTPTMKSTHNTRFSPSLFPTLVMLMLFPTLIALGVWQLKRAEQKKQIDQRVLAAQNSDAINLNQLVPEQLITQIKQLNYRKASLTGRYDAQHQFLLDNRTHQGKPGYHVLTPLLLSNVPSGTQSAVLINRGWIPYFGVRDKIPDISVDAELRTLLGTIKQPARSIVLKKEQHTNSHYPFLLQSIDLNELGEKLHIRFLPVIIELDKQDESGFIRDWRPYYGKVSRHQAYALQWFAMAAILLFLYIKLNTRKTHNTF